MSACNSKTELVAIYRLEFYKKQKNWKLGAARHDKKCPKKQKQQKQVEKHGMKSNLNTTYNVEREEEVSDLLNVAFVEDKSDNIEPQQNLSRICELSQQWLEPVNIWPLDSRSNNNYNIPNNNQYTREEVVKHVEKSSTCDGFGGTTLQQKNAMQRVEELLKLQGYEEEQQNALNVMVETVRGGARGAACTGCGEQWPPQSAGLTSAGHVAQEIRAVDDPVCSGSWFQPGIRPDGADLAAGVEDDEEGSWDLSVDSFGEFTRGADAAPHSSETDLSPPPTVGTADVSFSLLARMSTQQLCDAAALHSRMQRKLLLEAGERQRLRNCGGCDAGWGEQPTRDPGARPRRALSPIGRGRGRLPRPDLWG